jgi:hypothetical protein
MVFNYFYFVVLQILNIYLKNASMKTPTKYADPYLKLMQRAFTAGFSKSLSVSS